MASSARLTLPIFAALFAAACGGASNDTSQSSDPITINPGGPTQGALIVNVPAGDGVPSSYSLTVRKQGAAANDDLAMVLGQPLQLDPSTAYCLGWSGTTDCSVQVVAGQTTTYTLGGLSVSYVDGQLWTEFGSYAVQFTKSDTGELFNGGNPWSSAHAPASPALYYTLAGTYQATFSVGWTTQLTGLPVPAQQSIAVAQGQVQTWSVPITEARYRVDLVAPTRQYPDVVGLAYGYGNSIVGVPNTYAITDGAGGNEQFYTPQSDRMLWLPATNAAGFDYTLSVFGTPLTIPAGAAGGEGQVTISRIDVSNVTYEGADGGTETAIGHWTATRAGGAPGPSNDAQLQWQEQPDPTYGWLAPQTSFLTNYGIDVIAGSYTGTVNYNLQDLGTAQSDAFSCSF